MQPSHACDDMKNMSGSVMGESTEAMADHLCMTPLRPKQPGDDERAKALVQEVKASIEKYKDYKKALADGYVIANPKVVQPQAHFTNDANVRLADLMFDPTKPSSLLYYRTPTQRYKLEGVMFTDSTSATEDQLNQASRSASRAGMNTQTFARPRQRKSNSTLASIRNSACSAPSIRKKHARLKAAPFSRWYSVG